MKSMALFFANFIYCDSYTFSQEATANIPICQIYMKKIMMNTQDKKKALS